MPDRNHIRVCAALKVMAHPQGEEPHAYMTRNIGLGGLLLLETPRWKIGSEVTLQIVHVPASVEVRARVTRHDRDGVAFAFIDPSPKALAALEAMLVDFLAVGAEFDERRGEPRYLTSLVITWRIGGVEQQSALRDLSFKGAFVIAGNAPRVGSTCFLYLPAIADAGATAVEARGCEARVMHTTADGFGVRFESPSPEFRQAVNRLVRWLATEKP